MILDLIAIFVGIPLLAIYCISQFKPITEHPKFQRSIEDYNLEDYNLDDYNLDDYNLEDE